MYFSACGWGKAAMCCRIATLFVLLTACLCLPVRGFAAEDSGAVDFNRDIRPILAKRCFACHGQDADNREAGLRLDDRTAALSKLESGAIALVPGKPERSELIRRITTRDADLVMPPADSGEALEPAEIGLLKKWVTQGAPFARHWSFVNPAKSPLPKVKNAAWSRNAIDAFILARLDTAGLKPSREADKYSLVRRVSFDLRGLPPSPREVEQFLADRSADAYEKMVDRFLADKAYGERWARMWLDLARYADSCGYGSDPLRPNAWRYRDWVIDAFNRNLPYDQFTIDQLAGDLLPKPTLDQQIATAFHRNTMTNTEGGTDDEEFRVAAVKDRVDTTIQVWMGLTMGCAKCHNHKYDPVTQQEYYRFYAFFNQTADRDLPNEDPIIPAPTPEMISATRKIEVEVASLKKQLDTPTATLTAAQAKWEARLRATPKWTTLPAITAKAKSGITLKPLDDGSILASDSSPPNDTYTVTASVPLKRITAVRLEALPDDSLPFDGPGRGAKGEFVLSRFSAGLVPQTELDRSFAGRYVQISIPGAMKILHLAEVQVFSGGKNVATLGKARQSSTSNDAPAKLAIDGNTNGDFFKARSTTHNVTEKDPWWEVDLGAAKSIEKIVVFNRTDGNTSSRLANFVISVFDKPASDAKRQPIWRETIKAAPNPSATYQPTGRREVAFGIAHADATRSSFSAQAAIDPKSKGNAGWSAPAGANGSAIQFVTKAPLAVAAKTSLVVTLDHRHPQLRWTLGRFRLSVTDDARIQQRAGLPVDVLAGIDTPAVKRTPTQVNRLAGYYRSIAPELKSVRDRVAQLEKSKPTYSTVPVMQELPADKRRKTHIMVKGSFLVQGDEVQPGVLAAFHAFGKQSSVNRLGAAEWIVDRENPLTARVAVNRLWANIFGVGLVETEEDFGTQGEMPSHPELLDWLAVHFMDDLKWDTKALLKTILTSAAYRQSSAANARALQVDPSNRLLWRAPRYRLEAEMIRDQALTLAGLLSRKTHGPSVYPPQPPGLWRAAFNGQRTWPTSKGEDRYRRGLYTFWRRTVPYPSMATFDAPSREACTVRRIRTNTPLQALVTLNDPVYVEAAQALARRIVREAKDSTADKARHGLQLCLVRPPEKRQVVAVSRLYESELAHYRKHLDEAKQIATEPLGALPEGMKADELAAWTIVANVLLNLDGVLTRN